MIKPNAVMVINICIIICQITCIVAANDFGTIGALGYNNEVIHKNTPLL